MTPTILIATTSRWFSTARLAMAFADAGCLVEAVCPPGHPLSTLKAVKNIHPYHGLSPISSFVAAIAAAKPDLIVPNDDLATRHLHEIYARESKRGLAGARTCELIVRSLGAPESFPIVYQRSAILSLARELGVRVPDTDIVRNRSDLKDWLNRAGVPAVLKSDATSGGGGVRIVETHQDTNRAFRRLQSPPSLLEVAKRILADRDLTLVWPLLLRRHRTVNAQAFIGGAEATSLVACWHGAVLGELHFEVIEKQDATGPASVLRLIDHAEMSGAAEKIVRHLNLSGLHGFDFMLEAQIGNAYLIEMNPRATQVGHLKLGVGRDLTAALYAAVTGGAVRESAKSTNNETIALFPQEWGRNPSSRYLTSAYHDVPWQEPELIRLCVRKRRRWVAWYSQRKWLQSFSSIRRLRL